MLAKAGLKKHEVLTEKAILKEFVQCYDMEVKMQLDPAKKIS